MDTGNLAEQLEIRRRRVQQLAKQHRQSGEIQTSVDANKRDITPKKVISAYMNVVDDCIGVVGLGYVGLPLSLAFTNAGFDVVGVDIDGEKIERLRSGDSYVSDVSDEKLINGLEAGFQPSTEYEDLANVTSVSICVPTPLRKTGNPDLSNVLDAAESLAEVIGPNTTVILESTVYPGATKEILVPAVTRNNWSVGEDVFVAFSPERIDPDNDRYRPVEIPKVLGGVTEACGDRTEAFYSTVFDEIVRVDSATEAELVKLLENTYRAINIGMANEMALIADSLDVDIWNVIEAAASKPFGFDAFYPGPGLGGHCIPVDPLYLSWKANAQGVDTQFIDLADRINRSMPEYVVQRVMELLNQKGIALSNSSVLVLGVTYKANVTDTRESPASDIIKGLERRYAEVAYHDPYIEQYEVDGRVYNSIELESNEIKTYDCVVIVTDHDEYDFEGVINEAKFVFDTRGAVDREHDNVYTL